MPEARIDLLQHMPVFGGVRADILQFLLGVCPVVSVPAKEYFFHEHDQADSMFVLEAGEVAVLKSWHGQEYLLGTLKEGDCFGEMAVMDLCPRSASSAPSKIAPQSVFRQRASIRSTSRISSSSR